MNERIYCGHQRCAYHKTKRNRTVCYDFHNSQHGLWLDTGHMTSFVSTKPPKIIYKCLSVPFQNETLSDHYWMTEILKNSPFIPFKKQPKSFYWYY